jgi:uncharacterized protein YtpQ (UPF0354 family)
MSFFSKFFGPPDKNAFAKLILERLRQAGVTGDLQYDPDKFWIVKADRTQFYLGNVYAEYCRAAKSEREKLLKACISTWASMGLQPPEEFEDAKCDLMPLVKDRSYFEVDLPSQGKGELSAVHPYEIIADSLCVSLGYDLPSSVMSVNQELLDNWGVTLYEALEAAKNNLREVTKSFAQLHPSLYVVSHGDAYDASRLILVDLIEQMEVTGRHVAMIPNRETLIVAGDEDDDALAGMLKLAEESVAHERYITGMAYRLNEGNWESWLPPENHPLYNQFRSLMLESWARNYANQQQLLDARHERTGKDIYVGTFSALSHKASGRTWSYSVWTRGVPTLLPQTDLVMFISPREEGGIDELARGRWEVVERMVGHLMEDQQEYPPRYLVTEFPSPDELTAIGKVDLD